MEKRKLVASVLAVILLASGTGSMAAEKTDAKKQAGSMPGMEMPGMDMMHSGGMKDMKGMASMMNMMGMCNGMMQGGMMGHMLPQLPAGNEKLQLQMQAEMMQKMSEVLSKYAAQIKEEKK
ncbi:MAG: hypothetical protein HYZ18_11410 [Pseudogulbenkiania sp.]|nr:hypothetical protein [Pseudogulbenkiania sp.]